MIEMQIPTKFTEKAKFVRIIFTDVEREYDLLLHFMTLSFDWVWRRRLYAKMNFSTEMRVLDLACGTGLVTFELSRLVCAAGMVVGLDMSPAMLSVASRKKQGLQGGCDVGFVRAAGEFLPFRDEVFRHVTVGLALRNFGDKVSVFRETLRVLGQHGSFFSVDFVKPENALVWRIYRFHIFHVLPAIGGFVSGYWKRTLTYLANTILKSSTPNDICGALSDVGFRGTFVEKMTLGVVALIGGQKTVNVK